MSECYKIKFWPQS